MDTLKVVIDFFLNATLNKIFLAFGMLLLLLAIVDLHQWVKMSKFSRVLSFIIGVFFIVGSTLGILDPTTKILTNAKDKIEKDKIEKEKREKDELEKKKKQEEEQRRKEELWKKEEKKRRLAEEKKKREQPKVSPPTTDTGNEIDPNVQKAARLDNVKFTGNYGSDYIIFHSPDGNMLEFDGKISQHPVDGVVEVNGNYFGVVSSINITGGMRLLSGGRELVGTLTNKKHSFIQYSVNLRR